MKYRVITDDSGDLRGYVYDENGELTEEQARFAVLCNKLDPTEQDIIQAENKANELELALEYKRLRRFEYPPIGDQLDAMWKGGTEADEMLAKVQAVKAKYPKPSE